LAQSNLLTKIAYLLKNIKYYIFCTAPAVILCKSDMAYPKENLAFATFFLALSLVIPVLMLVFGIKNDELVCQSTTCIDLECKSESNKPLHLGAPSIGITVSQAFIVGGCFGLLISIVKFLHFIIKFFKSTTPVSLEQHLQEEQPTLLSATENTQQLKLQTDISVCVDGFFVLLCLAAFCWMCVSFAVYSQYTQKCSDYNPKFSIAPSGLITSLLGCNCLGIIVGFLYVLNKSCKCIRCDDDSSQSCWEKYCVRLC
jgi:hypothetical protein